MIRGPLASCAGENAAATESIRPRGDGWRKGERGRGRGRRSKRRKVGREVRLDLIHRRKRVWSLVRPPSHFLPRPHALTHPHTHSHTDTQGTGQVCGYVVGLSGLLTGFPPFITAGSLVLLLGGTAALGTVSPTSCNDGSLYMATSNGLGRK